jgi:hypothetical protein
MLTPPRLLTLVHAVQQPIGRPRFTALNTEHMTLNWDPAPLHASPLRGRTDPEELAPIVAWRRPGATDAFLLGAILVHGASTAKLDLTAEWTDPVDDPTSPLPDTVSTRAHVDEIPIPRPREGYLIAPGADSRPVGYYDPENDQIAMVRMGDQTGAAARPLRFELTFGNAAPRHVFNDAKRHRVRYTAVSTSRYREYFPQDQDLDFTRRSDEILVDVPASARPLAPDVVCVVPTFGWQRQTQTSIKRSVRFGGGLRVYLRRPWFSSGEGELLGVTLWSSDNGPLDDAHRDKLKPFFTQWGMDPIWQTAGLVGVPTISSFPDAQERDASVSLDESSAAIAPGKPGRVDVVGFGVEFDPSRGLWFADLTVNLPTPTYSPFVRLALVRYQPQALADARISRVVLAGFCQLTPDRSATVTADPVHPRTLRVVVSGVSPRGPRPDVPIQPKPLRPNHIRVRVQRRGPVKSDVGWEDVPSAAASVAPFYEGPAIAQPDLGLWVGTVTFAAAPKPGELRLLIEELEMISATHAQPGRVIYAETIPIDESLVPH